jgi:hypothetical protein
MIVVGSGGGGAMFTCHLMGVIYRAIDLEIRELDQ